MHIRLWMLALGLAESVRGHGEPWPPSSPLITPLVMSPSACIRDAYSPTVPSDLVKTLFGYRDCLAPWPVRPTSEQQLPLQAPILLI